METNKALIREMATMLASKTGLERVAIKMQSANIKTAFKKVGAACKEFSETVKNLTLEN